MKILIIGGSGYVGSFLTNYLSDFDVETVDIQWFNGPRPDYLLDYNVLSEEFLSKFDTIILLAAHCSVKMCENSPVGSFHNNVTNFLNLINKLKKQKFIYASSSSVYGISDAEKQRERDALFSPITHYDFQKVTIDHLAKLSNLEYYGLRFGSVNGYSPNVRTEIMLNSMVLSAKTKGEIHLTNPSISRPILDIRDLASAIKKILLTKTDYRGIYNLASYNSTSGELAKLVGKLTNKPVITHPGTPTYDFSINTCLFKLIFDFEFQHDAESTIKTLIENDYPENHRNVTIPYATLL